jgi:hypothetical protein
MTVALPYTLHMCYAKKISCLPSSLAEARP